MMRAGSSPLARGLPCVIWIVIWSPRIIPARAGFTPGGTGASARDADHPRSRGVYLDREVLSRAVSGSSPLARGLLGPLGVVEVDARIIPARAGFTLHSRTTRPSIRDHPRSRGVYAARSRSWARAAGSSPLARGLLSHPRAVDHQFGIIPARAGFTAKRRPLSMVAADHPRSRGVYPAQRGVWLIVVGSSPLARGLRGERRTV